MHFSHRWVRKGWLPIAAAVLFLVNAPVAHPAVPSGQTLRKVADGFVSPLVLTSLDADHLLVADQPGIIYRLDKHGGATPQVFLDLRPRLTELKQGFDERGLLGLALHPRFRENHLLYAYYSAPRRASCPTHWDHTAHLSEFKAAPDHSRADPNSERVLLEIDEPYFNHNCGRLAFGRDSLLYFGVGDGGNANDQGFDRSLTGNAQDLTTLLGKILRVNVDAKDLGREYAIPADNPFIGMPPARPEIFAFGVRNPWGLSFDRGGEHALFAADVGQSRYEEVNIIRKGGNYGWNQREGRHPFDPKNPMKIDAEAVMEAADRSAFIDPIVEYRNRNGFPTDPNAGGISVTGGYVYRGRSLPHLQGRYIFGDWSRQWAAPDAALFVATPPADPAKPAWTLESLPLVSHPDQKLGAYLLALGEDADGELYLLTTQRAGLVDRTGAVWHLSAP